MKLMINYFLALFFLAFGHTFALSQTNVRQVKSFELVDWHTTCRISGANCWLDAVSEEGFRVRAFRVVAQRATTGIITGDKIYQVCRDGRQIIEQIPGEIQQGWNSGWIRNACRQNGGLQKITMRAGHNAAFSNHLATIVYQVY